MLQFKNLGLASVKGGGKTTVKETFDRPVLIIPPKPEKGRNAIFTLSIEAAEHLLLFDDGKVAPKQRLIFAFEESGLYILQTGAGDTGYVTNSLTFSSKKYYELLEEKYGFNTSERTICELEIVEAAFPAFKVTFPPVLPDGEHGPEEVSDVPDEELKADGQVEEYEQSFE